MRTVLQDLVAELVHLKVDVFVPRASSAIRAAKQATKTIPIVMVTTADPVATGLVAELSAPRWKCHRRHQTHART